MGESQLYWGMCSQRGCKGPCSTLGCLPMLIRASLHGLCEFKNKVSKGGRETWWEIGEKLEEREWGWTWSKRIICKYEMFK